MRSETRASIMVNEETTFDGAEVDQSEIDALWFSRSSSGRREAWELRLVAESPYALFETFAADEPEEVRKRTRKEMETRLREYASAGVNPE